MDWTTVKTVASWIGAAIFAFAVFMVFCDLAFGWSDWNEWWHRLMTGLFLGAWVVALLKRYYFEGKVKEAQGEALIHKNSAGMWETIALSQQKSIKYLQNKLDQRSE